MSNDDMLDRFEALELEIHRARVLCKGLLHVVLSRMKVDDPDYKKHIHEGSLIWEACEFVKGVRS